MALHWISLLILKPSYWNPLDSFLCLLDELYVKMYSKISRYLIFMPFLIHHKFEATLFYVIVFTNCTVWVILCNILITTIYFFTAHRNKSHGYTSITGTQRFYEVFRMAICYYSFCNMLSFQHILRIWNKM